MLREGTDVTGGRRASVGWWELMQTVQGAGGRVMSGPSLSGLSTCSRGSKGSELPVSGGV